MINFLFWRWIPIDKTTNQPLLSDFTVKARDTPKALRETCELAPVGEDSGLFWIVVQQLANAVPAELGNAIGAALAAI